MTVKERILSIRLLEKAEKQWAFAATLGLEWTEGLAPMQEQGTATTQESKHLQLRVI